MLQERFSQLTTKEVDILTAVLERSSGKNAFERLLRHKLNSATVHFPEDIPRDIVTLNSRVFYTVNGQHFGPHIVVQSQGDDLPAFALSIHTMRGIALLGMAVGDVAMVAYDNGRHETIAVEELAFQPESERQARENRNRSEVAAEHLGNRASQAVGANLVFLQPRRQSSAISHQDPDGDGPGPAAA